MHRQHIQSALAVVSLSLILQAIVGLYILPAHSISPESAVFSPYNIPNQNTRHRILALYRANTNLAKNTLLISSTVGLLACGIASIVLHRNK
jgi:hypothetical protein